MNTDENKTYLVKVIIIIIIIIAKEPVGLFRTDRKSTDGLTLMPWQSGKSLCWDVTVTCPLAESYIEGAAWQAGSTANGSLTQGGEVY